MEKEYGKQGYLLEDFRLFHLRGAQGIRSEYHYHEFCKVLLLRNGTGSYWIEGRQYPLQPGDVVLVGDGCPHRPDFDPESPYERIILYISPDFLRQNSTPDCDLTEILSGGKVLRMEQNEARQMWGLAQELEGELSSDGFGRVILSTGLLLRLIVNLGRQMTKGRALQPGQITPQNGRIRKIMEYIEAHLTEELTVEQIAEEFFLSKYHMMRLFRSSVGIGVYQYITQRRLEMARQLIASGVAATESCFRSGFGSYSSFTRAYGKHFGTTPTGKKYAALREEEYPE